MSFALTVSFFDSIENLRKFVESSPPSVKELEIAINPQTSFLAKVSPNQKDFIRSTVLSLTDVVKKTLLKLTLRIGDLSSNWESNDLECCTENFLLALGEKLYTLTQVQEFSLIIHVESESAKGILKEIPFLPSLICLKLSVSLPESYISLPLEYLSVRKMPYLKELSLIVDCEGKPDSQFFSKLPSILQEIKAPNIINLSFGNWTQAKNIDLSKVLLILCSKPLTSFCLKVPGEEQKTPKSNLIKCLKTWESLERLELFFNFRSDLETSDVITSLSKKIKYLHLSLEHNLNVADTFCETFLLESLSGRFSNLTELSLNLKNNSISLKGYKNLANALKTIQTIGKVVLHLGNSDFMLGLSELVEKELINLFLSQPDETIEKLKLLYSDNIRINYEITRLGKKYYSLDVWGKLYLGNSFKNLLRRFQASRQLNALELKVFNLNLDQIAEDLVKDFLLKKVENLISLVLVFPSQYFPQNLFTLQNIPQFLVSLGLEILADEKRIFKKEAIYNIMRNLKYLTQLKCLPYERLKSELENKILAFGRNNINKPPEKLQVDLAAAKRKKIVTLLYALKVHGLQANYRRYRQVSTELVLDFLLTY